MAVVLEQDYNRRLSARKRRARIFYAVCVAAVVIALVMLVALLYSVISEALAWYNLEGPRWALCSQRGRPARPSSRVFSPPS